jgi:hypothetical protein
MDTFLTGFSEMVSACSIFSFEFDEQEARKVSRINVKNR